MPLPDSRLAHELLDALEGIEIGASAANPFNLPRCLNVDYTASSETLFKREEYRLSGKTAPVDVAAPGDRLPFRDACFDYVLSSHVLEHFWDPIGALQEWLRVLRPGGLVFAIVPHRERTVDSHRARTPLDELLDRRAGIRLPPAVDDHRHWSVWITEDLLELGAVLGLELVASQDVDDKVGNGFTVVFRKPSHYDTRLTPLGRRLEALGGRSLALPFAGAICEAGELAPAWRRHLGALCSAPDSGLECATEAVGLAALRGVWAADVSAEAFIRTTPGVAAMNAGVLVRYSALGDTNFYLACLAKRHDRSRWSIDIIRDVAGERELLATTPVDSSSGRLRLVALGSSLVASFNGLVVASTRDDALGAGRVGLRLRSTPAGAVRVESFSYTSSG